MAMLGLVLDAIHMALALHLTVPPANPLHDGVSLRLAHRDDIVTHLEWWCTHETTPHLRGLIHDSRSLHRGSSARETQVLQVMGQVQIY